MGSLRNEVGLLTMDLYHTSEKGESILLHNPTHQKETRPHTVIKALTELAECTDLTTEQKLKAKSSLHHVENFGTSSPTTCGYQIVSNDEDIQVVQFFCSFGVGICHLIQHHWTHTFLATSYSHYTSAPLFIHEGKVYSEYDSCNMLAWGKGGEKGSYSTVEEGLRVRRSQRLRQR
eukprot:scaffold10761_cov101-Skeletonema_marinoi.AAC.1